MDICKLWDAEISNTAHHIDELRQNYFDKLKPYFNELAQQFFQNSEIGIEYKRGWPVDRELSGLLTDNLQKERLKGFTYYGPHRAEVMVKVNGQSAQTCISRGQQKTLVALMRLAQAKQFTEAKQKSCVLLYDDLAAELDSDHRARILSVLSKMNIQLFLTAIEAQQIDISSWDMKCVFHVEHGSLTTVD